jgi:two-component system sensor histidine kinase GlrK
MWGMRLRLPKSLNGFLLLGLAVIAVPLLVAIVNATLQMRRQTTISQRLVQESVQTTRLSQDLYGQIASLERAARLYQVLGDANVLATFRQYDERLAGTVEQLRAQVRSTEAVTALTDFSNIQRQVRSRAVAPGNNTDADMSLLGDQAGRIGALINARIDDELRALEAQVRGAQRQLFWEASLLVPLVLLAIIAVTFGVARPLRQLDRAITELGGGDFANAIAVRGPVDLERLGTQLEWLRNRLLELAQERNRFLRHMSHELKTPLANIREGTELLMDGAVGPLDSGQREVAAILQDNGIKLQRLIENLLSFSAWQSNSLGLEPSEFRLRPLIKQVLENQQLTLVSQRVRLEVQIEELALYADRGKLRLILENLLSNAIKYSPRGGVIHLRAVAVGDQLQLDVADTGAGIPKADRLHIFDAFYTGRAPGGHVKGTGIGLSVVHEFVGVHKGHIEIVDGEYPGAHFRIRIPLQAAAPAPSPAPVPTHAPAATERPKAHAA